MCNEWSCNAFGLKVTLDMSTQAFVACHAAHGCRFESSIWSINLTHSITSKHITNECDWLFSSLIQFICYKMSISHFLHYFSVCMGIWI